MPTQSCIIAVQSIDLDCCLACTSVSKRNTAFNNNINELFVQGSPLHGTLQRFVSATLRPVLLHFYQYSLLTYHLAERQMNNTMTNEMC